MQCDCSVSKWQPQSFVRMQTEQTTRAVGIAGFNFIAGRPKAALLFWFFGGFRCGVPLFIVMLVIY